MLTTTAVICQIAYDGVGFADNCNIASHFMYTFQHVNIWHLLCNLLVLWSIRNKMNVIAAYGIAIIASYFPMYVTCPTSGMSGLLFAMFGIMWGNNGNIRAALRAGMPSVVLTVFLPHVNGLLHLYCYIIGITYGILEKKIIQAK